MYSFDDQRVKKLDDLREMGVNPYPSGVGNVLTSPFLLQFDRLREMSIQQLEVEGEVCIAARLRFKNELGSMGFGRVEVRNEIFQFSIQKNKVSPESFKAWKKLDLGDWILITGSFTRTRAGELTLAVKELSLYSKCIESMPDKHSGLTDSETCQRMRYLDLMVNQESRKRFQVRSQVVRFIRDYLGGLDFMEVETPTLQVIPGGASAEPFITHHKALDVDLYMRIAPELYLKRLIVGGFERVFEIGKNFRNEGISTKHNPEFTTVEFYQAHAVYTNLMELTESMFKNLVSSVCGEMKVAYRSMVIDFDNWHTVSFENCLRAQGVEDPWSLESLQTFWRKNTPSLLEEEVEVLKRGGLKTDLPNSVSTLQQWIFDEFVEPTLVDPTFITHYPTEISPLARKNDQDPRVTDRFELFIAGFEVANGFSELNDPVDQAERFKAQAEQRDAGDNEAMYFDADYIKALSYGMPPTAGEGIGIDRLVMLLTNAYSIRDVILFPTRKVIDNE